MATFFGPIEARFDCFIVRNRFFMFLLQMITFRVFNLFYKYRQSSSIPEVFPKKVFEGFNIGGYFFRYYKRERK